MSPISQKRYGKGLHDAITELAALKEYWSLMADTDPVQFMKEVKKEILTLRGKIGELTEQNKEGQNE